MIVLKRYKDWLSEMGKYYQTSDCTHILNWQKDILCLVLLQQFHYSLAEWAFSHLVKPHLSHLTAAISHMDLGRVGHLTKTLHAFSLPAPHRFWQDLQLQVLALPQILALCLKHTSTHKITKLCNMLVKINLIFFWTLFSCLLELLSNKQQDILSPLWIWLWKCNNYHVRKRHKN